MRLGRLKRRAVKKPEHILSKRKRVGVGSVQTYGNPMNPVRVMKTGHGYVYLKKPGEITKVASLTSSENPKTVLLQKAVGYRALPEEPGQGAIAAMNEYGRNRLGQTSGQPMPDDADAFYQKQQQIVAKYRQMALNNMTTEPMQYSEPQLVQQIVGQIVKKNPQIPPIRVQNIVKDFLENYKTLPQNMSDPEKMRAIDTTDYNNPYIAAEKDNRIFDKIDRPSAVRSANQMINKMGEMGAFD